MFLKLKLKFYDLITRSFIKLGLGFLNYGEVSAKKLIECTFKYQRKQFHKRKGANLDKIDTLLHKTYKSCYVLLVNSFGEKKVNDNYRCGLVVSLLKDLENK